MTRDELIAALEAAQEGDEALDIEIALFVGWKPPEDECWNPGDEPKYTALIDVAVQLLPAGASLDLHVGPHHSANDAIVYVPRTYIDHKGRRCTEFDAYEARAARGGILHWNRPALAICIAALRARSVA